VIIRDGTGISKLLAGFDSVLPSYLSPLLKDWRLLYHVAISAV